MKKRCRHHRLPSSQLALIFSNGDTMPKIPDPTPGVEEAVKRAQSFEDAIKHQWDESPEERHERQLWNWRPKVKVVNWTALTKAVKERGKFAREWTDWFVDTPDGRPVSGSGALWAVDGANAVSTELRDAADLVLREAVLEARKQGETWSDIASHLNITKSAAIARYGDAKARYTPGTTP
jgi:hypothetical protein